MELTDKRATLHGIEGAIVGACDAGTLWQADVDTGSLMLFLRDGAAGATLDLRSESGVTHARVQRCWVDAVPPNWRLRVVLEPHAVA